MVIKIRKSKKNRQHNGQKKKYKRTNKNLQNIHINIIWTSILNGTDKYEYKQMLEKPKGKQERTIYKDTGKQERTIYKDTGNIGINTKKKPQHRKLRMKSSM